MLSLQNSLQENGDGPLVIHIPNTFQGKRYEFTKPIDSVEWNGRSIDRIC